MGIPDLQVASNCGVIAGQLPSPVALQPPWDGTAVLPGAQADRHKAKS